MYQAEWRKIPGHGAEALVIDGQGSIFIVGDIPLPYGVSTEDPEWIRHAEAWCVEFANRVIAWREREEGRPSPRYDSVPGRWEPIAADPF